MFVSLSNCHVCEREIWQNSHVVVVGFVVVVVLVVVVVGLVVVVVGLVVVVVGLGVVVVVLWSEKYEY
jgi:hypothetical protein